MFVSGAVIVAKLVLGFLLLGVGSLLLSLFIGAHRPGNVTRRDAQSLSDRLLRLF